MKGLSKVFSFTCRQIMGGKNYKGWTVVLALLFFLIPAVLMPLSERNRPDPDEAGHESDAPRSDEDYLARVKAVFYAAETEDGYSWNSLQLIDSIPVTRCSSAKEALRAAEQFGKGGYALLIREEKGRYSVNALMPDDAETDDLNTAMACANTFANLFPQLLGEEMQITSAQKAVLNAPIGIVYPEAEESDANVMLREIANIALPYLNIMLIYFLVLFYGNTVANQVILEKTSKLMDTFLVSVKPRAMVFGKVLAVWVSSLLQLLLWAGGLAGGCALGAKLARSIHPQSTMGILRFFDYLKQVTGFFSPVRILLALLLIAAGFTGCETKTAGAFHANPDTRGRMMPGDGSHHLAGKLFSAGDMRTGQSLVVRALADGRAAAGEVNLYLASMDRAE